MKNVLEYLEETTLKYGDKIAIIEDENKCTYTELLDKSKRVGSALLEHIKQRQPVPVLMDKGIDCLSTFMGIVYAGAFYVLLNPDLPNFRLKSIIDILETDVIITNEENIDLANQIANGKKILKFEDLKNGNINEEALNKVRSEALDVDPLYANFTSGSTGTPKGVIVGHRSVIDFIDVFTKQFDINNDDIIANQAPFDFDVSVKDIYSALKVGATLLVVPKKLFSIPVKLLDYLCDNNATTMIWAVSALTLITTFHGLDYRVPEKVNKILFSGEVMPLKHLEQWMNHLPNAMFVNVYGPTEITCNCTYHIIDRNLNYDKKIPIGKAFENEQVFLLDEQRKLIEDKNKIGEICVKGTALALGYYNDLKQTNDKFIQNPLNDKYIDLIYITGDMGYIGNDDNFYFTGRKDFQIKHMGHRIELEEIERVIYNVKGIERVCCIYLEEKSKICAFYIGNVTKQELQSNLREILPIYMIPNIFNQVDEFPLTKNGKVDRKQLLNNMIENKNK